MYTQYWKVVKQGFSNQSLLEQAVRILQQGGVLAIPTETTYGLAGSILNPQAIKHLFEAKKRPKDKPLPIAISSVDQIKFLAIDIPQECQTLTQQFFPGPLTIILKKHPNLLPEITSGNETVAIRFPFQSFTQRLISMVGCPVALPSANLSGTPSPTKASHVFEDLNGCINGIIDGGNTTYGMDSTLLSLENPAQPMILRRGIISRHMIEKVLKRRVQLVDQKNLSSISQFKPAIRLFYSWNEVMIYLKLSSKNKRLIMSSDSSSCIPSFDYFQLNSNNLYHGLRLGIRGKYSEILVYCSSQIKQNEPLLVRLKQIANT